LEQRPFFQFGKQDKVGKKTDRKTDMTDQQIVTTNFHLPVTSLNYF